MVTPALRIVSSQLEIPKYVNEPEDVLERLIAKHEGYEVLYKSRLHVDEAQDEAGLQIAVLEKNGSVLLPAMRQRKPSGEVAVWFPYSSEQFKVITANGNDAMLWQVLHARGNYEGMLDGIVNTYNPSRERLELAMQCAVGEVSVKANMCFRRNGEGFIATNELGAWILPMINNEPELPKVA